MHCVTRYTGQTREEAFAAYRHPIAPGDKVILQTFEGPHTPESLAMSWGHRLVAPPAPGQPAPDGWQEWEDAVSEAERQLGRSRTVRCGSASASSG